MQATEYTENLFQAVDVILNERLRNLPYDQTIVATVIEVVTTTTTSGTTVNTGKYKLQSSTGKAEFYGYGNLQNYKTGDMVYVRIPNGDFSRQKIITGLYYNEDNYLSSESFTLAALQSSLSSLSSNVSNISSQLKTNDINTSTITISSHVDLASYSYYLLDKDATKAEDNTYELLSVGGIKTPVYIKSGAVTVCTEVAATTAEKLTNTDQIGSSSQPVYFTENGVPAECENVAADTANKLSNTDQIGSSSQPVYFTENGVPEACENISAATADTADRLSNTNQIGSSSQPVYFMDGVPEVCESVAAAIADRLSNTNQIGSSSQPVYFMDGVPEVCESVAAAIADKLSDADLIGSTSKPIYFTNGKPAKCGPYPKKSGTTEDLIECLNEILTRLSALENSSN